MSQPTVLVWALASSTHPELPLDLSPHITKSGDFQRRDSTTIFSGQDDFWVFDAVLQYRLPKGYGLISVGVNNPLGIFLASFFAVKTRLSQFSGDISWRHIIGAGFLGGIGLTMSIFITLLAFNDSVIIQSTKISILLSSLIAGGTGFLILNRRVSSVSTDGV